MRHTSLYRKWRPRKFGEISGQEAVVRTLRRAIETDRVAHAYLFSGPRGTGKTSSAKVLAMGLNCQNSDAPTPEPCGECGSCRAVVNNSSLDIVEMDAASNRGIDEIRDLRDRVNLAPASGRFKVYIIDEIHMLTPEAFNALLKTLEEPPEQVVFILATTDKHRVPATIVSRCQSFEFRRPGIDVLSGKLAEIAAAENIAVEPEALTIIARAGGGSFRDAEGLLDQLSSFSEGEVTAAQVRELLGSAGPETLIEVTNALAERRVADALRVLESLSNEGRDLGRFAQELTGHLRNVMLLPHAPEVALAEVGADEKDVLREQAEAIPTAEAVRSIEAIGEATGRIRRGSDAKLELELTFMKLARDYTEPAVESLVSRLEALENSIRNGDFTAAPPTKPPLKSAGESVSPKPEEILQNAVLDKDSVEETGFAREDKNANPSSDVLKSESKARATEKDLTSPSTPKFDWHQIMNKLESLSPAHAAVYGEAEIVEMKENTLELSFPRKVYVDLAKDSKRLETLQKALENTFTVSPRVKFTWTGDRKTGKQTARSKSTSTEVSSGGKSSSVEVPSGELSSSSATKAARSEPPEVREVPEEPPPYDDDEPPLEENPPGGTNASGSSSVGASPRREVPRAENEAGSSETVGASGTVGGDGTIRDQQEVFQMAREHFGPF